MSCIRLTVINGEGHVGILLKPVRENGRFKGYIANFYDPRTKKYYQQYEHYYSLRPYHWDRDEVMQINADEQFKRELQEISRSLAFQTNDREWYDGQFT
ncbi:hypothetical protein [Jeotgalibacillus terrae]|uniref:Uncharacterized protein n=1 Tax=Jeotgalibacillus terrae TaxID=587735 RepID=A0ABW5ZEK2_9BACL|nr:hypothetical protein [Jeotgalibacillus terrae]MBM7580041.1 hypothetical protein [Jeotgalibacillus terrae]